MRLWNRFKILHSSYPWLWRAFSQHITAKIFLLTSHIGAQFQVLSPCQTRTETSLCLLSSQDSAISNSTFPLICEELTEWGSPSEWERTWLEFKEMWVPIQGFISGICWGLETCNSGPATPQRDVRKGCYQTPAQPPVMVMWHGKHVLGRRRLRGSPFSCCLSCRAGCKQSGREA